MKIISKSEAKVLGLLYYYTGQPCKNGHHSERYTSCGRCFECARGIKNLLKVAQPLRQTWYMMLYRCTNEGASDYDTYGGRGISVCARWLDPVGGYDNFVTDMGERPEGHTLDRIDNDGNYEPFNCRWADGVTQSRNTSHTKIKGEDVFRIRGLLSEGLTRRQVAAMYSCAHGTVTHCRRAYA